MSQRVAFGTTLLDRGLLHNGIDGIGQYCEELLNYFSRDISAPHIHKYSFGVAKSACNAELLSSYGKYLARSAMPFHDGTIENQFFNKVDVIHSTDQLMPVIKNKPLIATVMDTIPITHPEFLKPQSRLIKPYLWRKLTGRANHIITISEFSKQEIIKNMKFAEDRVTSIPLGVDKRFFKKIPQQEIQESLQKLNINKPFFLFIGSIQPRKNLMNLIEAHSRLPKNLARDFPLLITGKLAWIDNKTFSILKHGVLDKRCIWLDYVPDFEKRCLLQSTIGLVFVSQYEGFGLPILEAFASEAPVITSNCSSMPEVAGNAAILVNPNNQVEITDAMHLIIQSPPDIKKLQVDGLERAKIFSWEQVAQKTKLIYSLF